MIYLYDVIHYAHTRTSVPTSARTHKEKKKYTQSRTHTCETIHSVAHARVSTHIHTRANHTYLYTCKHTFTYTHARGHTYTRTWARVSAIHTHTHIHITSLCERRRTTNETSIHVYVCTCTYSEYLTNVFYRVFFLIIFFILRKTL